VGRIGGESRFLIIAEGDRIITRKIVIMMMGFKYNLNK